MSRAYLCTFTGFTGAQFSCPVIAWSIEEAREIAEAHMCAGDSLTIEQPTEILQ